MRPHETLLKVTPDWSRQSPGGPHSRYQQDENQTLHQEKRDDLSCKSFSPETLRIGRPEYPAQVEPRIIAKDANGFERKDPAGMKTDGEIKIACFFKGVAKNRADEKQAKQPRGDGSRIEKQMERACQVAKSRPWIGLYKHCVVSRANEMDCGKYQARD